ncbi:adenosine receptor A3-like [Patiria miniata]|uniref:G-protein coupled receptors family 1 profile domain-containing protein n=1 Tax=Patiria miniata TaxID=46514 RepID=A0A914ACT7_PATMI|nr:adenosine receptor A3-like [Patiria miniata]
MTGLLSTNWTVPESTSDLSAAARATPAAYYIVEGILALCGFLGNSLVILLFALEPKLRLTVSNIHLVSLALSDLLMGTVAIPILLVALQGHPRQFPFCLMLLSVVVLIDTASVFALCAMTLDRYYSITRPLQYSVRVTKTRATLAALLAWLVACLLVLPMPLGWHHQPSQPQCSFVEVVSMQYMTYVFFSCILVPFLLMCGVYIRLYGIIQKQLKQIQALHETGQRLHEQDPSIRGETLQTAVSRITRRVNPQDVASISNLDNFHRIKREVKTATFFAFLMLFFFVSWMPISIVDALLYFGVSVSQAVMNTCVVLSHTNSAFNPLLYALKADFRAAFRQRVFLACRSRHGVNAVGPTRETVHNL